jgi:hypothetical protein
MCKQLKLGNAFSASPYQPDWIQDTVPPACSSITFYHKQAQLTLWSGFTFTDNTCCCLTNAIISTCAWSTSMQKHSSYTQNMATHGQPAADFLCISVMHRTRKSCRAPLLKRRPAAATPTPKLKNTAMRYKLNIAYPEAPSQGLVYTGPFL